MDTTTDTAAPARPEYFDDIPQRTYENAFAGTSWTPERRAASYAADYAATLAADFETFKQHATKGGTLDKLAEEFARYRAGYRTRTVKWLHSRHGLVSSWIAGPSGFPAARMNKRADIAGRRQSELCEWRDRAMRAVIRNLRPDLRPIMAGDADAVERLDQDIAKAERYQDLVKRANVIIRREQRAGDGPTHTWQDRTVLMLQAEGFTERRARNALEPDYAGRVGIPSYILTNNSANIRRMKARREQIAAAQAAPVTTIETESGVTMEDDPPANRVRLFFPGKPAQEVRDRLKRAGFRWAPTIGAWQAYRNAWSLQTAQAVAAGQ